MVARAVVHPKVASLAVCDLLDGDRCHIRCGTNSFAVRKHNGYVSSFRGGIINVLTNHGVVLDPRIKGGVRGAVPAPQLSDIGAQYDRRWFVVTGNEMMDLKGVNRVDALAQCLWRYHCSNLIKKVDSVQIAVDSRMMLFPELDISFMNYRVAVPLEVRVARYKAGVYQDTIRKDWLSMLLPNYSFCDLEVNMGCFSKWLRVMSSNEEIKTEIEVGDFLLKDGSIKVESELVCREASVDFTFTFRSELSLDEFARLRGEFDIPIYGGCSKCYVLLGHYNYREFKFKLAPDKWTQVPCVGCRSNSGIYSDHPREWPQAGVSVVTQIIWESRFILPVIQFDAVGFGLLSKYYGGNGLLFSRFRNVVGNNSDQLSNIISGLVYSYDYYVRYTGGAGVNVGGVVQTAGVSFVVGAVDYHRLFSYGYAKDRYESHHSAVTYVICSGDAERTYRHLAGGFPPVGIRFFRSPSRLDFQDVFVRLDSNMQPVDVGWVDEWILLNIHYSHKRVRFWLFVMP